MCFLANKEILPAPLKKWRFFSRAPSFAIKKALSHGRAAKKMANLRV